MTTTSPRPSLAPWGETIAELEAAAVDAEAAGFRTVWTSELHRSAFVPLAALARATNRIGLGNAIAWAFPRSPMVTALSALDLDELSDGRFTLGLGTGVKRLNSDWHNRPFDRPVARLRETIGVIRALVAGAHLGQDLTVEGELEHVRLRGYQRPFPPVRTAIPIYVASVGPQLTRLAGEIADGWIAHELGSPAYLRERILPHLEKGAADGGRDRRDITVVASACCVPDRDERQAKRFAAGLVAFYATVKTYDEFFDFHGFLAEARKVQERFRAGEPFERLADAVPDAMADGLTFAGSPDTIRERMAAYDGLADVVKLSPPTHGVPVEATRTSQQRILELFSDAT